MNKPSMGHLKKIPLREYWEREDTDFTPWLALEENIARLGEAIGMELEVLDQETSVGPFRADILCRNASNDSLVLIENQLEPTDHGHLGQLITYAAGLDAVTLIWIAESFKEQHRAAVDWLNSMTSSDFQFFGLEVELYRIGSSDVAPHFPVIASPNDWSKAAKDAGKGRRQSLSMWQETQIDFWTKFGERIAADGAPFKPPKPRPSLWVGYGVGRAGVSISANFTKTSATIIVEVNQIDHPNWFSQIKDIRSEIESEVGETLQWEERPEKKFSHISVSRDCEVENVEQWEVIQGWMLENMISLKASLSKRVRKLHD